METVSSWVPTQAPKNICFMSPELNKHISDRCLAGRAATKPKARRREQRSSRSETGPEMLPQWETLSRQPRVVCAVLGKIRWPTEKRVCREAVLPHTLENVPAQPSWKTASFCRENKNPCAIFKS